MRKTISHLADRLGDAMATLFTILALLLIPHAVIRAIIGQALHRGHQSRGSPSTPH